jgi:hypothetical protein
MQPTGYLISVSFLDSDRPLIRIFTKYTPDGTAEPCSFLPSHSIV